MLDLLYCFVAAWRVDAPWHWRGEGGKHGKGRTMWRSRKGHCDASALKAVDGTEVAAEGLDKVADGTQGSQEQLQDVAPLR